MTDKEALKVLHQHQKWRRGADVPQLEPEVVGEAIDCAIRLFRKHKKD